MQVPRLLEFKYEAAAIIATYLGSDHYLVSELNGLPIHTAPFIHVRGVTDEPPATKFLGLVNAAVAVLEGTYGHAEPHPPICDPELWEHVEPFVAMEAWATIPREVTVFVEDWCRKRAGTPRHKTGAKLVGKDLFAHVLGDQSELKLGTQASEHEGWRFLGMGLAQAIGNQQRHNLENRPDAEQFAWGVVGLGSLLLGELRQEHDS